MNVAGFRSEDPSDSRGEHGVCRRKRDVRSGETNETGKDGRGQRTEED